MFGGPPLGSGARAARDFMPAYGFAQLRAPALFEEHNGDEALPWLSDFYLTGRQEGAPIEGIVYQDSHVMADRHRQLSSMSRSADCCHMRSPAGQTKLECEWP